MTTWLTVIAASVAVLLLKAVGYLVPKQVMERPVPTRTAGLLTVALLSALVVTQTIQGPHGLVLDARLPALVVAAVLLAVRAPFVVVVIAAAGTAAVLRLLGWFA